MLFRVFRLPVPINTALRSFPYRKTTQTIEIELFVEAGDIPFV